MSDDTISLWCQRLYIIIIRYLSIGRCALLYSVLDGPVAGRTLTFYYDFLLCCVCMQGKYTFHNIIVIRYFAIGWNVQHVMINEKRFFFFIIRWVVKRGRLFRGINKYVIIVACDTYATTILSTLPAHPRRHCSDFGGPIDNDLQCFHYYYYYQL